MMYTLKTSQILKTTIEEAWEYFSSPQNLSKITPETMGFKILSDLPEKMYSGMIIHYTVKPLAGIPLRWVTEISQIDEPNYFIDNQLQGPYKIWHHEHHFKIFEGGIEMTDILNYSLPFGILGRLAHALFIRKKVESIFEYRRKILDKKFNASSNDH